MGVSKNVGSVVLLFLLALVSCEAQGLDITVAGGRRGGRRGRVGGRVGTIFNVMNYGAKPDGRHDNTQAFMKAWVAACHWKGSATLLIPAGTFLIGQVAFQGPCSSPTPMIVEIRGTLKAQTDISEFPSPEWVSFESINGLVVTGGGTLDGQGGEDWQYNDCHHNSNCQLLPTSIKFNKVTNGVVKRIKSINSKSFHMFITNCNNFRAHHLHITAPENSPNTDGIHVSSSNMVRIARSVIGTGDDCISIGQGSTNVLINKVQCGPGHGISVGSLGKYPDEKDVAGIIVKNCTLLNTENGVRIKTWPGSPPSAASGFLFQDLIMNNVKNPILIDQQYCPSSSCSSQPSRVRISNVHYRNIRGTSTSNVAVKLMCSKSYPCQNVELLNINFKFSGNKRQGGAALSSACSNARVGYRGIQIPPPCR